MHDVTTMTGHYDPFLVLLSYLIAVVASFTALALARRVAQSDGRTAGRWLVAGAFSMGIGIWSMHFVGMLAFRMAMPFAYDVGITALSMGVGVLASGFALYIGSRPRITVLRLGLSGLVMGLGIAAMHYTGMAAMEMEATIHYDPALFAASVVLAVLAATAALWIAFSVASRREDHLGHKVGAALVMGLAICGMHYTGMAAAVYTHLPGAHHGPAAEPTTNLGLALTIGATTLLLLAGTLLTIFFDYKLLVQKQVEARLTRLIAERTQELTDTVRSLELARDAAETAARAKSVFLANMSHEIRTPLTGILGFTSVLAEEVTDPQHQEFVGLIEKSGRRLMDTLNSVLDLAQLDSGTQRLHVVNLDAHAEADEVIRVLRPLAEQKGLRLALAGRPAPARADRAALGRVLVNLVGNAIKFTEHGGITVTAGTDAGGVFLRVTDTGVGIAPAFLPHLFDEFKQESEGHERTHEGNGLGLAITKRLVVLMGGTIAVESTPGHGSTFTVTLPPGAAEPIGHAGDGAGHEAGGDGHPDRGRVGGLPTLLVAPANPAAQDV